MHNLNHLLPIFPILYAEIHHTLRGFSLVHRRWPEIICDAPHRIDCGQSIPILILVKDAHRYPIILHPVEIEMKYPNGSIDRMRLSDKKICIDEPWWFKIKTIQPQEDIYGSLQINVPLRVQRKGKQKIHTFLIDNYRGSSHLPLDVSITKQALPQFKNWVYGDLHYHSNLTHDQTEFGAPLEATVAMAKAMGLSFAAVTDHSYDLDDMENDFLRIDPQLAKWHCLRKEVEQIERRKKFIFIPGEEVSCGNQRGKNIHLLLLNNHRFFPGSGDSAERWFRTKPEHSLREILNNLEERSLAFAAHPEDSFTILHRIFLSRGRWMKEDYSHPRLNGLQVLNGIIDRAFQRGIQKWIRLLLQGRKISIVAGNDAHGNFNRFRQLGLPFLYLRERSIHLFARARTAVFVEGELNRKKILEALARGESTITTGPALLLEVQNKKGERVGIGGNLFGSHFTLTVKGISTEEFGALHSCKIWYGKQGDKRENLLEEINQFEDKYTLSSTLTIPKIACPSYLRGELFSEKCSKTYFCLTNPIWLCKNE